MVTEPDKAKEIVDKWLGTEFKGAAPANKVMVVVWVGSNSAIAIVDAFDNSSIVG